jgi:hypothetical protein
MMDIEGQMSGGASAPAGAASDLLGGSAAAAAAAAPADGGEGAAFQGAGGQAAGDPDWYGTLSSNAEGESASNLDWIKAKGFKDIDSVAKALRSAEKAIHDSGRIKLPGEGATAEDVAAYHRAIGVPDAPGGYEFAAPQGADGQPMPLNAPMLERSQLSDTSWAFPRPRSKGWLPRSWRLNLIRCMTMIVSSRRRLTHGSRRRGRKPPPKLPRSTRPPISWA